VQGRSFLRGTTLLPGVRAAWACDNGQIRQQLLISLPPPPERGNRRV